MGVAVTTTVCGTARVSTTTRVSTTGTVTTTVFSMVFSTAWEGRDEQPASKPTPASDEQT